MIVPEPGMKMFKTRHRVAMQKFVGLTESSGQHIVVLFKVDIILKGYYIYDLIENNSINKLLKFAGEIIFTFQC